MSHTSWQPMGVTLTTVVRWAAVERQLRTHHHHQLGTIE